MKTFKIKNSLVIPALMVISFIPFLASASSTKISTTNNKVTQTSKTTKSNIVAVSIVASDFAFTPSVINAKQGDTIKLTLTGADAKHSFYLPAFKVNTIVNPGQTKTVSFKVNKKGSFTFTCHIPCGSGHKDMKGTVIVG